MSDTPRPQTGAFSGSEMKLQTRLDGPVDHRAALKLGHLADSNTALLRADFTVQLRNGRALVLTFILPLALLYATFAGKRGVQLGDPLFRIGTSLTLGIASIAILGYTATVARDREKGVFQRLRVTPAPTWTIMVSRLAVQVVSMLAMTVVVLSAAAAVEKVSLDPAAYVLTLLAVIFSSAVFLGVGQALVGLLRSADTVNAVGR